MVSIACDKVTLPNGLPVILHQDNSLPLAAVNVWYHVGSKDEEPGRTGFAHLFEHVMFEGSKHHNHSYFEPLQKVGANLNGSTNADRTNYWEDVPSNYLELALWLEADRMGFLLDALDQQRFDIQRDVVKNERRQSYENRPYGMAQWHIQKALFPLPHPYHWMTIGSQEDLDAASLEDIKDFFQRFYSPSNASLAIAGDLDKERTLELVNRYFGDLPPGPAAPRIGRFDSALAGRVELEMRDKVSLPRIYLAWPARPEGDPEEAPLELLRAVLADGQSSRLYRALVYEQQVAQSVSVRHYSAEIAGQFVVEATAAAGRSLTEVAAALETEIDRVRQEPPTEAELARARNRLESSHYRQLSRIGGFGGRVDSLNYYNTFYGDPERLNTALDPYLAVQPEQVLRAAQKTLNGNRVQLRVLPEESRAAAAKGVSLDRAVRPEPAVEPTFAPPLPVHRQLPNGLQVTVVEKPGLPIVAFALLLPAGAIADPPTQPGLSFFTAQMLSEGTATRSSQDLANAFEFIGARLSIETRRETSILSAETLTRHWPQALALLADVVQNPTFPEHELERVRREHLTDLRRGQDDPTFIAEQLMPGLVFGRESRYGHPSIGTAASVAAFTREQLADHFRRHCGPAAAHLLVVGDVSVDAAVEQAAAALGGWDNSLTAEVRAAAAGVESAAAGNGGDPGEAAGIYLVDKPGAAQSVIRAGHTAPPRRHPDFTSLGLLNYAFGGQFSARLNLNLRQDKGYSYGFHSGISWFREWSMLVAGGSVQTAVTKESVAETLQEFRDIQGGRPARAEEVAAAKAGLLLGYPAGFERPGQILGQLIQLILHQLPDDYFRNTQARVSAVTLEQVRQAGAEWVRPEGLRTLVVGDRAAVEPGLRELGLPLTVLDADGLPR